MRLGHPTPNLASRARAAGIHLGLSAVVATVAAILVFAVWYPAPFREISGGRELFLLLVTIDVIVGPLITFAVFDRRKPPAELARDLGVVVLLQLAALTYGMHTMAQARPAVVALEGDRLRVVRAIDLSEADWRAAPPGLDHLSWTGPRLLAARPPATADKLDTIEKGLAGQDIGMRPELWRPPSETGPAFAAAAKPLADLVKLQPKHAPDVDSAVLTTGRPASEIGFLPILARNTDWSALVDRRTGEVVGYVAVEGF